jgi:hypothetical protein
MTKDLREDAMFQVQMLGEEIQPDWIGLTDEEITDLYFDGFSISKLKDFARAIEAKLKEKNGL